MILYTQLLQAIDQLHDECSKLDKIAKLAYLKGQWNRLNQMAWQYGAYLQGRVRVTPEERQYAQTLINMINEVETEGVRTENDLRKEVLKGLANALLKGF